MAGSQTSESKEKKELSGSITIRLADLRARLNTAAEKLDLSENDLARHAIRALVESLEANQYRILWPPKIWIEGDKRVMKL